MLQPYDHDIPTWPNDRERELVSPGAEMEKIGWYAFTSGIAACLIALWALVA